MRRISSEPLLILYCYLLPFHLQSFNGYMTPCTYAIIWIKNRGYRIETQSRLPTLRFAMSMSCCASAAKKRCGLSAAANAPQISVGYTIDCLFYAISFLVLPEFLETELFPYCYHQISLSICISITVLPSHNFEICR